MYEKWSMVVSTTLSPPLPGTFSDPLSLATFSFASASRSESRTHSLATVSRTVSPGDGLALTRAHLDARSTLGRYRRSGVGTGRELRAGGGESPVISVIFLFYQ